MLEHVPQELIDDPVKLGLAQRLIEELRPEDPGDLIPEDFIVETVIHQDYEELIETLVALVGEEVKENWAIERAEMAALFGPPEGC